MSQEFSPNNKRIAKNTLVLYVRTIFVMAISLYKQTGESLFTAYTISAIGTFGTATFEKREECMGNIGIEEYFITDEYIDFCLKKLW